MNLISSLIINVLGNLIAGIILLVIEHFFKH